jgi:hypothetical protein
MRARDHAAEARQQKQRHDPRLRQRHVVPPRPERDEARTVSEGGDDERGCEGNARQRQVGAAHFHERGEPEQGRGRDDRPEQAPVREPGRDEKRCEGRQRQRREQAVCRPELGRAGDDCEQGRARGGKGRQPQPRTRNGLSHG